LNWKGTLTSEAIGFDSFFARSASCVIRKAAPRSPCEIRGWRQHFAAGTGYLRRWALDAASRPPLGGCCHCLSIWLQIRNLLKSSLSLQRQRFNASSATRKPHLTRVKRVVLTVGYSYVPCVSPASAHDGRKAAPVFGIVLPLNSGLTQTDRSNGKGCRIRNELLQNERSGDRGTRRPMRGLSRTL